MSTARCPTCSTLRPANAAYCPKCGASFKRDSPVTPDPASASLRRNSLAAMANVLQLADLRDQGVLVELKLPLSSKRLDVLITGSNPSTGDAAVVVELRQWTEVVRSNITGRADRRVTDSRARAKMSWLPETRAGAGRPRMSI